LVVVIRGAGDSFCAGGDLAELTRFRRDEPEEIANLLQHFGRALSSIATLPVPVIAVVHGAAVAGGFELMLACDLAIVALDARLGDHHARFGQVPAGGGSQRLPRLVGRQRALSLLLTGDHISAEHAVEWGLAVSAFPPEELEAAAAQLVGRLTRGSAQARATIKRLVHDGAALGVAEAIQMEHVAAVEHLLATLGGGSTKAFVGDPPV
jgi:enoyl-CoA hydratase/carnithine racemase